MFSLKLFGECQATIDGKPISLQRHSEWLLLSHLVIHRHEVNGRSILAEAVRENPRIEMGESKMLENLSSVFYSLRKDIGDNNLLKDSGFFKANKWGIGLINQPEIECDVWKFDSLCEQAKSSEPTASIRLYEKCIALYVGELMGGFYIDWVLEKREIYKQKYVTLLGNLSKLYEQINDLNKAVHFAEIAVRNSFTDEFAHHQLILLLVKQERFFSALKQFETCKNDLIRIGRQPLGETEELIKRARIKLMHDSV
ncbi:hypothetical protein HY229_08130 [Candidatus Acetothermia bacterium]|nr:hypothetical protein [Candidatus Acetothermia bacterium]MBI3644048.1 hypothetical protein [Candidatus Acetothermia bacterium]